MVFKDRRDAGKKLAQKLQHFANKDNVLVLALPRGGVPVAFEVSQALKARLDIFIVRKLGVPGQEELAMGAIASGGVAVLNERLIGQLRVKPQMIDMVKQREQKELARREALYRHGRSAHSLENKQIILVDDGLATGASMMAAAIAVRKHKPAKVIIAVPIAAEETCMALRKEVDEIVCYEIPEPFWAVGAWYEDFTQTTDAEVESLLDTATRTWKAA